MVVQDLLDKELATQSVQKARTEKVSLVEWLIRSRLVSAKDVAYAASLEYGLSMVDLDQINIPPAITNLLTPEQMKKLNLIPLNQRGKNHHGGLSRPHLPDQSG